MSGFFVKGEVKKRVWDTFRVHYEACSFYFMSEFFVNSDTAINRWVSVWF